jgi:hypothetical protein
MAVPDLSGRKRVRYHDDQLLAARDLQDDEAYRERMRGLHVVALHNTWRIAVGLSVSLRADGLTVQLGPGMAYDCRGREIVLSQLLVVAGPIPPPGGAQPLIYDLAVRYRELNEWATGARRVSACPDDSSLLERPVVRWALAGEVTGGPVALSGLLRLGEDVPLARFVVSPTGTLSGPDLSVRRYAKPLLRPYMASGVVQPSWLSTGLGYVATIDTSAAGFTTMPFYFASLVPTQPSDPFAWFLSFSWAVPAAFQILVVTPQEPPETPQQSVFWVGIEPITGSIPSVAPPTVT